MTPGGRQHVATRALRIAAALLVLWGTLHLLFHLGGGTGGWPPDEEALRARAALTRAPGAAFDTWRCQLETRGSILTGLRAALSAEPDRAFRRALTANLLSLLDGHRTETELRREAGMGPEASAMAYRRGLRPALKGSPVNPEDVGEALGMLALLRAIDRSASPGIPLVEDEFREELTAWLAGS